ncbi:hypothetical protein N0V94_000784 [Neodidymelliopsis sp. IMI 364377]|nr:hypothetical protein N0V94_000784 [Neodidymelliopsis sp. IMI 364377]
MATTGAGLTSSRRNSNVLLGLVGVPTLQEPAQTANEFDFDFDNDFNDGTDFGLDAQVNSIHNIAGLPNGQTLSDFKIATRFTSAETGFEPSEVLQAYPPDVSCPYAYDTTHYDTQPTYQYPDPQSYYTPHPDPYFDNCFDSFTASGNVFCTPGLAAVPTYSSDAGYINSQYSSNSYAYPTESWMVPTETMSFPTNDTGYVPVAASAYYMPTLPFAAYPHEDTAAIIGSQIPEVEPVLSSNTPCDPYTQNKRLSSDSDSDDDEQISHAGTVEDYERHDLQELGSDSDPDSDYHDTTTVSQSSQRSKRASRHQPRNDSVSSNCTSSESASEPVKYLPGEKPKKVDAKPWIRTNANTEGDTRTAKINNWKNKYKYKPLPLGGWSSGRHTFKYTKYENVDFLTEAPMSTRKIREYIMNYPCDSNRRLIIWIQKMPADQGRRYGSKQHSKCVFRDCPIQQYVEGTISTGEYRVAFDEKYYTYGDEVDPFDCAAYAHLYCMENFLDFEQVCQAADVRIDTRLDMPLEPNGKAAFSMVGVPARGEMARFVKAASMGELRNTKRWRNYPVHNDYARNQQKPHELTLICLAHRMYEAYQDDSHKRQAALRRVTVSQRRVHLGDLETLVADKRIVKEIFGSKKKAQRAKVEDYYDNRIRMQIARAKQEAEQFLKQDRQQKKKPGKKTKKRKAAERDEDVDDHSEPEYAHSSTGQMHATSHPETRATRHKKQRVQRVDSPQGAQDQFAQTFPPQHQYDQASEQRLQELQTYIDTSYNISDPTVAPVDPALVSHYGLYAVPAASSRKSSCSSLFPSQAPLDISNFPASECDIPDDNLDKLLALERRQSCTSDIGPMSILKSQELVCGGKVSRRAIFSVQPVSESKEYSIYDPPKAVAASKLVAHEAICEESFGRRSARLAAKTNWPGETIGERRLRKRARLLR